MPQITGFDPRRRPLLSRWTVFSPLVFLFFCANPSLALMVGTVHDFVDDGFTGGGVCAECHVPHNALDDRLWSRLGNAGYATAPQKLCMDCHDGSMPTEPEWTSVSVVPPSFPHSTAPKYETCGDCHNHQRGFVVPNDDCLVCHTTAANGGRFDDATEANLQVDRVFNGIGLVNDAGILSQHNIVYAVDGNPNTPETAAQNECKKCHGSGTKHPGPLQYLVYPDDFGTAVAGDPVAKSADYADYQDFCLSCHDGADLGPANPTFQQFGGAIPLGQVGPSNPADPSTQQGAPPWDVAAVPPKDVNAGGSFANSPPFFDYFETNGHGLATGIEGTMDVTCLSGTRQGCHSPHGTTSRFLIDDGTFVGGTDTVGEVVNNLCYGCHVETDLGDPDNTILASNLFHGSWVGSGAPLHAPTGVGLSLWRQYTTGFMDIASPFSDPNGAGTAPDAYAETAILPFYSGSGGGIEARAYTPALGGSYVACLSCHDPHGTAATHWDYKGEPVAPPSATENTQAMLRRFPITWDYQDPLCAECHSR